jgi:hypothetical protein
MIAEAFRILQIEPRVCHLPYQDTYLPLQSQGLYWAPCWNCLPFLILDLNSELCGVMHSKGEIRTLKSDRTLFDAQTKAVEPHI